MRVGARQPRSPGMAEAPPADLGVPAAKGGEQGRGGLPLGHGQGVLARKVARNQRVHLGALEPCRRRRRAVAPPVDVSVFKLRVDGRRHACRAGQGGSRRGRGMKGKGRVALYPRLGSCARAPFLCSMRWFAISTSRSISTCMRGGRGMVGAGGGSGVRSGLCFVTIAFMRERQSVCVCVCACVRVCVRERVCVEESRAFLCCGRRCSSREPRAHHLPHRRPPISVLHKHRQIQQDPKEETAQAESSGAWEESRAEERERERAEHGKQRNSRLPSLSL